MKLEGNKSYKIKNVANGRMIIGTHLLEHGDETEINTIFISEKSKKMIEFFIATGQLEVSIADVKESKQNTNKTSDVVSKETTKNDKGDTHQHVVYDPETARKNRALAVEPIETAKAIETSESKLDLIEFLEKHWKTIERDLANIVSIEKLESLLLIADEQGMKGNKKYELIKNRIKELK